MTNKQIQITLSADELATVLSALKSLRQQNDCAQLTVAVPAVKDTLAQWSQQTIVLERRFTSAWNLGLINCPQCGSAEYGYDLDEKTGTEHWACYDCKLGIEPTQRGSDGFDHACGYHD